MEFGKIGKEKQQVKRNLPKVGLWFPCYTILFPCCTKYIVLFANKQDLISLRKYSCLII